MSFLVHFTDDTHGEILESFSDFDSAVEFWNDYADTPSCQHGKLVDDGNGEIIWEF